MHMPRVAQHGGIVYIELARLLRRALVLTPPYELINNATLHTHSLRDHDGRDHPF